MDMCVYRGLWLMCGMLMWLCVGNEGALTAEQEQSLLDLHNSKRREAGASNMRYMSWSTTLADKAQRWANKCVFEHDESTGYGENLYAHSSTSIDVTNAVLDWHAEKANYDYDSITCNQSPCGHYTQVVWATTYEVGCGQAVCDTLTNFGSGTYIVCNYNPTGNSADVKPYKNTGEPCRTCDNGIYNCYQDMCMTDCTDVTCECKACGICQNCASITPDCSCQCAAGWRGNTCVDSCENTIDHCASFPGDCDQSSPNYAFSVKECPAYCGFCEVADGNTECTVSEDCNNQSSTEVADGNTECTVSEDCNNQSSTGFDSLQSVATLPVLGLTTVLVTIVSTYTLITEY